MSAKLNHKTSALRVCVDAADRAAVGGRVYGQWLSGPLVFGDLAGLLVALDKLLDGRNFPQSSQRMRSFFPGPARAAGETAGAAPQGPPAARQKGAEGRFCTFSLTVLTRRGATWQGRVDWLDGQSPVSFSSDLGLLRLVERRLFLRAPAGAPTGSGGEGGTPPGAEG